ELRNRPKAIESQLQIRPVQPRAWQRTLGQYAAKWSRSGMSSTVGGGPGLHAIDQDDGEDEGHRQRRQTVRPRTSDISAERSCIESAGPGSSCVHGRTTGSPPLQPGRFEIRIVLEGVDGQVAAEAGLLEPAEGRGE